MEKRGITRPEEEVATADAARAGILESALEFREMFWEHLGVEQSEFFDVGGDKEKSKFKEKLAHDTTLNPIIDSFLASNGDSDLSEENIPEFLAYLSRQEPRIYLGAYLKSHYPEVVCDYLVDIKTTDRLEELDLTDEEIKAEYRFALKKYDDDVIDAGLDLISFKSTLKESYIDTPMSKISSADADFLRKGLLLFFDEIFTEADEDEVFLDFTDNFIQHFEGTQTLDLGRHKTRQETIWFTQQVEVPALYQSGFTTHAIKISDAYGNEKNRAHPPKHRGYSEQEKAFPFEHFMAVTRLALGVIDGLEKNAFFDKIPFLNKITNRSYYETEAAYTALLHDIIEDKKMTPDQVEEFLQKCSLPPALVTQILDNLNKLNNKRIDPETGERITLEKYVDGILASENPILLIVKYADIVHNNKSETPNKWISRGENKKLSEKWVTKQKIYEKIIEKITKEPLYIRQKELVGIFTANPELLTSPEFSIWKKLLKERPDQTEIIATLPESIRAKVMSVLST